MGLPTRQDVLIRARLIDQTRGEDGEPVDQIAMLDEDTKISEEIRENIQNNVLTLLRTASKHCRWGIIFKAVKIQQYELDDYHIGSSLKDITRIDIEKHLVNVTGDLNVAIAEAARLAEIKKTEGSCEARHQQAIAEAAVDTIKAEAQAYASETNLKAKNQVKILKEEAKSKIMVLETTSLAEAEAKYQQTMRQNEAAGFMTDKQYELEVIKKSVAAMGRMGDSAWRMPDKYTKFYDQFAPMVKIPKL